MEKTLVRIEQKIPLTIFDEPALQKQVVHLFNNADEKIKARVNEIVKFLESHSINELSYDDIVYRFRVYFCKMILNEAIEITFSGQGKYNALSNILSLLTEEKLETAILGKPMIDAFSGAIRSLPTTDFLSASLNGSTILLLEKAFLEKPIFPTCAKKIEQYNYCGSCDCSCTCDGSCKGNPVNCTSKKAIKKNCNHHCNCFVGPMTEFSPTN